MASLFLVLKASPEQEQHAHFVWNIARAAEAQGHTVTVHVFGDGIYYLVPGMKGVGPLGTAEMSAKQNLSFTYCNYNVEQRGLENQLLKSARKASTTDASVEFLKHDRALMISG